MDKKIYGRGAAILTSGNSTQVKTGAWKNKFPVHSDEKCKNCMLCVPYCPEGCIYQIDGKLDKIFQEGAESESSFNTNIPTPTKSKAKGAVNPYGL